MDVILKYFNFSDKQIEKLKLYVKLLLEWNKRINLISRKDQDHIWTHHILHSLSLAKVVDFSGLSVVDIGTGGGLPGIPLAIAFPSTKFTLVDSVQKKVRSVTNIVDQLKINNINVINVNAKELKAKFDFVIARSVTQLPKFYKLTKHLIEKGQKTNLPNGILYLKGGDLSEELRFFPNAKVFEISQFFQEPFFISKKIVYLPK